MPIVKSKSKLERFEKQDLIAFIEKQFIFVDVERELEQIEKWRKYYELKEKMDANIKKQNELSNKPNPTWEDFDKVRRLHKRWSKMFDEQCELMK